MKICAKCGIQENQYLSKDKFIELEEKMYCPYCANLINETHSCTKENENKIILEQKETFIENILIYIGYGVIFLGIFTSILLINSQEIFAVIPLICCIIIGVLFIALAEIIRLLVTINNKLSRIDNNRKH